MMVVDTNILVSKLPLLGFPASSNLGGTTKRPRQQKLHCTPPVFIASTSTITPSANQMWAEFGEKISGEWDGFGADFTVEGKPVELPESVVPEAYREWDVKVFDWQTQCPTTTQQLQSSPSSSSSSLFYKTIRLLPTVGCEADAATTYTIQDRHSHESCAFAYHPITGSYVALWPHQQHFNNNKVELEHCLIDPFNKESRVRIVQALDLQQRQEDLWELRLKSISVFVEQWYGPFRNGEQLGGCGLRESAFATTQPLEASHVFSDECVWEGLTAVATFPNSQRQMLELGDERAFKSIRRDDSLILLPKQLWCSVKRSEDNTTCCEVGWLLDQGRQAITSKCTFSSSSAFIVEEIALTCENATTKLD